MTTPLRDQGGVLAPELYDLLDTIAHMGPPLGDSLALAKGFEIGLTVGIDHPETAARLVDLIRLNCSADFVRVGRAIAATVARVSEGR